ncbi:pentapeptide repeat-containing protein [Actinobacillus seminis]|uniref:pentapeptide repeat-containing protein n=1 Tax=Actinobacillus seminis TaxID=722 RepID=UPI003B945BFA
MSRLPRYNSKIRKYDRNYSNILLAKTISSKLSFNNRTFFNVNFRGARLRKFKLTNCNFILCDFSGTIMNKGKFTNVIFKKCVFCASILRGSIFKNCKFQECFFINMSEDIISNCEMENCLSYNYYDLTIPLEASHDFDFTKEYHIFQKNRLIHIKGGRVNKATIFIILQYMPYNVFIRKLKKLCENNLQRKIFTVMRLLEILQKTRY